MGRQTRWVVLTERRKKTKWCNVWQMGWGKLMRLKFKVLRAHGRLLQSLFFFWPTEHVQQKHEPPFWFESKDSAGKRLQEPEEEVSLTCVEHFNAQAVCFSKRNNLVCFVSSPPMYSDHDEQWHSYPLQKNDSCSPRSCPKSPRSDL